MIMKIQKRGIGLEKLLMKVLTSKITEVMSNM